MSHTGEGGAHGMPGQNVMSGFSFYSLLDRTLGCGIHQLSSPGAAQGHIHEGNICLGRAPEKAQGFVLEPGQQMTGKKGLYKATEEWWAW